MGRGGEVARATRSKFREAGDPREVGDPREAGDPREVGGLSGKISKTFSGTVSNIKEDYSSGVQDKNDGLKMPLKNF